MLLSAPDGFTDSLKEKINLFNPELWEKVDFFMFRKLN